MQVRIIFVLAFITGFCLVMIYNLIKALKNQKELTEELVANLERQKKNVAYLFRHCTELADIEKSQRDKADEISGGKTDEEIVDIINSIIRLNDGRVRDDSER